METTKWNFDILIDCSFADFNKMKDKINPDDNSSLLSIVNDFEDGKWRYSKFKRFVFDNIAQTALSAKERKDIIGDYSHLVESAKHIRLVDDKKGKGSEIAEIVLYGIMKHHFKALSATPKIFYKQNDNDNAKGADSVHILLDDTGEFQLWLGEAKFYNSLENKRLKDPIESVHQMLKTDILRKEISIITSLQDLDNQIDNQDVLNNVKRSLSGDTSIDTIKPILHIPILLLHECNITSTTTEMNEEYKNKIISFHKDKAHEYFKKQINELGDIPKYKEINFHLILLPVPQKERIVADFITRIQQLKEDSND